MVMYRTSSTVKELDGPYTVKHELRIVDTAGIILAIKTVYKGILHHTLSGT